MRDKNVEKPVTKQDKLETIRDILDDNDTPMVTTIHHDKLISRPMKMLEAEFDGTLWFATTKDTAKFDEIRQNPNVNVAFAGKGHLSLSGKAELVEDLEMKKRLWNRWMGKFFDLEYDDPNLILIRINPESAEYWEAMTKAKSILDTIKVIGGSKRSEEEMNSSVEL